MDLNQLRQLSYVPYSGRPGIAVAESRSGNFFPGVRIENVSFPLTIPAEQAALYSCLSEGELPQTLYTEEVTSANLAYWKEEYDLHIENLTDGTDIDRFKDVVLNGEIKSLLRSLLNRAVTGNSDFPVSAILEAEEGRISGVNIEGGSWESGLCAERVVLAKAMAHGVNIKEIRALHLHTLHGEYSSPCGACRQVIVEHLPRSPVIIHHPDGSVSRHFSSDLLPYSFKSDFLKKKTDSDRS